MSETYIDIRTYLEGGETSKLCCHLLTFPHIIHIHIKSISNTEVDEDGELERKLEGIRVNSKPNVQWSDVAGLNEAKEILDDVGVIVCLYFLSAFTHRCFYLIYNPRQ